MNPINNCNGLKKILLIEKPKKQIHIIAPKLKSKKQSFHPINHKMV